RSPNVDPVPYTDVVRIPRFKPRKLCWAGCQIGIQVEVARIALEYPCAHSPSVAVPGSSHRRSERRGLTTLAQDETGRALAAGPVVNRRAALSTILAGS